MSESTKTERSKQLMSTLPGDDVRQIMWRFADRYDLQMVVQSTRGVARGVVANLVADGARNTHDWTPEKNSILTAFDEAGLTQVFMDPAEGGFIEGPKNLALALVAFELAWVDGGAATSSLAGNLGLAPIHEKGTPEQRSKYMHMATPPQPGEDRQIKRGAFALTEPLPFVGVDTGVLSGKVRIDSWEEGEEPLLQVDKRGRFITNMDFANFVTAAVDSDDERIKGSCMVILEEDDPGLYDRGVPDAEAGPSALLDPRPGLQPEGPGRPHHRRLHGQGRRHRPELQPRGDHRVGVPAHPRTGRPDDLRPSCSRRWSRSSATSASRFRGGASIGPDRRATISACSRKKTCLHRLVDIWATGEASASLGFDAARLFDEFDPLEKEKEKIFAEQGLTGRAQLKVFRKVQEDALEYLTWRPARQVSRTVPACRNWRMTP